MTAESIKAESIKAESIKKERFKEAEAKAEAKASRLSRARRTALLKALADPRRYELLERIAAANCPLGCSDAVSALRISPATLSHHVKELENAGLIEIERVGKFHNLKLRPGVLEALAETLQGLSASSCRPL
jgi:ArsR family transcriptional regulator, arsenate/arsenite/antimonite-responsive transcriptional repressor